MTRRTIWLFGVMLGGALLLGGCSSSGGGGGGGNNNGGDDDEVVVVPNQFSAEPEQEVQLAPSIAGVSNPRFQFTVIPPAGLQTRQADEVARLFGSVDSDGLFVAGVDATEGARGSVRVQEQTSGARTDVALVIVRPVRTVVIEPDSASLLAGQTVTFRATAFDFADEQIGGVLVDWRVEGGVGTIDKAGAFRGTSAGEGMVAARVGLAPVARVEVTVVGTVTGLSIVPLGNPVEIETGTTRQFRAIVSDGSGNQTEVEADWSVTPAGLGTIDADGQFTAGASGQEGQIRATAQGESVSVPVRIVDLITPPGDLPGNVFGQVTDAADAPVAGATVTATRLADEVEVDSVAADATGRFGFFLPAGNYRIEATAAAGTADRNVTLPAQDVRVRADLELAP